MRLDVFLKTSRLVKRRSLAKEFCEEGAVSLNGQTARAGREVHIGDELRLRLPRRLLSVEILEIPSRAPSAANAQELYRVLRDERRDEEDPEAPDDWSHA